MSSVTKYLLNMGDDVAAAFNEWQGSIEELYEVESKFLELEASDKPFFSTLFLNVEGKSIPERESKVYSDKRWREFANGLAAAKAKALHFRRLEQLSQKRVDFIYLQKKMNGLSIERNS